MKKWRHSAVLMAALFVLPQSSGADAVLPKGVLRYRAGVMRGFGNPLGFAFIHGFDATLHLGSGRRPWVFGMGWEIEWGCYGPRDDIEPAKLTVCAGPGRVDATSTSIKTLSARPLLSIKRRLGETSSAYLGASAGVGFLRTNTPLRDDGQRTFVAPAGALFLELYFGRVQVSASMHYEGPPLSPGVGWFMLGIGYGSN